MIRILFICLGNICRSPSAEGILLQKLEQSGLAQKVKVDSAGIGGWHVGDAPDIRAQHEAMTRGYNLAQLSARQLNLNDFNQFDIILAMDQSNLEALRQMPQGQAVVDLFLNYALQINDDVKDPYYGNKQSFKTMFDVLEHGCDAIIQRIQSQLC